MQINKKIIKKYWYIALICAVFVIFFVDNLKKINKGGEKKSIDPTAITELSNEFDGGNESIDDEGSRELLQEHEQAQKDFPLWELMPYEGDGFKISHYSGKLIVVVYIENINKKEGVENKVRQWIKENGGDEKSHQIDWR